MTIEEKVEEALRSLLKTTKSKLNKAEKKIAILEKENIKLQETIVAKDFIIEDLLNNKQHD